MKSHTQLKLFPSELVIEEHISIKFKKELELKFMTSVTGVINLLK